MSKICFNFMSNKNSRAEYETPQIEVIEARVERGFAVSGGQQDDPVENPGSTLSGYSSTGNTAQFS